MSTVSFDNILNNWLGLVFTVSHEKEFILIISLEGDISCQKYCEDLVLNTEWLT